VNQVRLYIDEDAMDTGVVRGLRARGIDVMTASDMGMICQPDEEHLRFATGQSRVLYSFNVEIFPVSIPPGLRQAASIAASSSRHNSATRSGSKSAACSG
jgi:hypothetical protein